MEQPDFLATYYQGFPDALQR
ncbi:hypothetical protein V3C99_003873, partial [Haemonchus contortus]